MRYNGIDPTTLHRGISIAKEIPPGAPTSQLETLTGASGEIITGRTIKQAEYIVRVNIAGKSREEAWDIRALLAKWACSTDEETHRLEPTRWSGVAYDAIFKEITPPEFVFGFAVVDVIFAIPRPIATKDTYSMAIKTSSVGNVTAQMTIKGTSYVHPILQITMNNSFKADIYVDDVVYAAVNYQFAVGDGLEIITDPPSVYIHTGGSTIEADMYVDYTVTDFDALCRALMPGTRLLKCAQGRAITVRWREEYL